MSYSIICDARKGHNLGIEILALVDRTKSKSAWWTSDGLEPVMEYRKLSAAQFCVKRLRKNNPRIVSAETARRLLSQQSNEIAHHEALAECELGWDGHK